MKDQHASKSFGITDKERLFSKSIHKWLAQYDEEEDFLYGKISNPSPEFVEE